MVTTVTTGYHRSFLLNHSTACSNIEGIPSLILFVTMISCSIYSSFAGSYIFLLLTEFVLMWESCLRREHKTFACWYHLVSLGLSSNANSLINTVTFCVWWYRYVVQNKWCNKYNYNYWTHLSFFIYNKKNLIRYYVKSWYKIVRLNH